MSLDINQLYDAGIKAMADQHEAKEAEKIGILRAGNTGVVLSDGKIAGPCARQTLLRLEGLRYEGIEDSKRLMFDAGLSNEDIWVKSLEAGIAAMDKGLVIKREEEIPISWTTPSGVTVTGRPDIVIGRMENDTFLPTLGIELKLVSSVWTARDTGVMLEPKLAHLMQTAHYSWKLDVPFQLWYTNRAEFAVGSGWEQRTFPSEKDLLTHVLEFGQSKGKVTVKKVLQYRQGYELDWTANGQLKYRPILSDQQLPWTFTPITKEGIVNYYEAVVAQRNSKKLAPRPLVLKADGSPGSFNACDYCPLKSLCDSSEKNYERWMSEVQVHVNTLK